MAERTIRETLERLMPVVDVRVIFRRNNPDLTPFETLPDLAWRVGAKLYTEALGEDHARLMVKKAQYYNQFTGTPAALNEFATDVGVIQSTRAIFAGNPSRIVRYEVTVSNLNTGQGAGFLDYLVRSFKALLPVSAARLENDTIRLAIVSPGNFTLRGASITRTIGVSRGRI